MRKKFLLMFFALLGTAGAWAGVRTTYQVTKNTNATTYGTWYNLAGEVPDGSTTDGKHGNWGRKFVSWDEVLTFCAETEDDVINTGFNNDGGFRIRHNADYSSRKVGDIIAYTLSVPENYTIISYTFKASTTGNTGNSMKISLDPEMADPTTVKHNTATTEYTKEVNEQNTIFYLQHGDVVNNNPFDAVLTVVVEAPISPEQAVREYLTNDKIANINKAGEYGYPKTTTQTYQNIKAIADKLNDTPDELTQEDYQNVETYYNAYLAETDIVVPETGKFYRMYAVNAAGNKYLFASDNMIKGRRIQDPSTLSGDASFIWYLSEDNTLTALSSGLQYAGTAADIKVIGCAGGTTVEFVKSSATSWGKVSIRSNGALWFIQASADGESDLTTDSSNGGYAGAQFFVEEVTTLPITLNDIEYATLCSPVALTILSDDVTAYVATGIAGTTITLDPIGGTIPANVPVILEGTADATYNFDITTGGSNPGTNILTATGLGVASIEAKSVYTLQNLEAPGFYTYTGTQLPAFKAYLPATSVPNRVKGFTFDFGTTDGIATVEGAVAEGSVIYNLAGQRVEKAVKGVYIVNGKKVLVK